MKLKYYLRGLGIGIVVAVIITSVSMGNRQPMTDEEIKERAAELGMIENSVLADIADKDEEPVKDEEPTQDEQTSQDEEQLDEDVTTQEQEDETADEPQTGKEDEQTTTETGKDTISITVVSGDTSWTVSKRMEEAGLIESAKDFDTHLCRYGYDKKISVGTYKIPVTATHEEMAKILTRMD